ncbi:SRPBCC family protein [Chitinimonas koreensis]|uniref:SRPBCC family protein n=1 Tax=Chitinimonas koreensis TaxID=356302 RepID=UPI00041D4D12|nr:SRPBCC family protein [Chitinimonas koreensis]QNM96798.1 SRPBCC domain-containing protein [Chitinimonas koreensis]
MTTPASDTADREIVITRLLKAPPALVWQAWTDPAHIARWWGPTGFSNTISEMEVREGGVWRFVMHGPDGVDYPNRIDYDEVVPGRLLRYRHSDDVETGGMQFDVTVTFADEDGQTRLTMRTLFATAAERTRVVEQYGAIEGGRQTMDRLEAHLAGMV